MPDETRRPTAAESFVRGFFDEPNSREADLGVLALERALIRGLYRFVAVPESWGLEDVPEIAASDPVDPSDSVGPIFDDVRRPCEHVVDWIVASCRTDAGWLKRLDREGRPVKLTKIGSLDRAVREADKAMLRFAGGASKTTSGVDDETPHAELADGWRLVRLLTSSALDRESFLMQHCIGQGAYDEALSDDDRLFLSLRDPSGRPHATLDVSRKKDGALILAQFQGKQNRRPIERHVRRVRSWLRENVAVFQGGTEHNWWSRMAFERNGQLVDLDEPRAAVDAAEKLFIHLMEGDVLPTDLLASMHSIHLRIDPDRRSPVVLPKEFRSNGIVALDGEGTFVFGDRFRCGSLMARGCSLERLPGDFAIHGPVDLTDCSIDLVPGTASMGPVTASGTRIAFGENIAVATMHMLKGSCVALPATARIDELLLHDCTMEEIPDGCSIRHLTVKGGGLGRIGRSANLDSLRLENVPPDLAMPCDMRIGKDFVVKGPSFPTRLPGRLRIDGEFVVSDLEGLVLPPDLEASGLTLDGDCVEAIPDGTSITGRVLMRGREGLDFGSDCRIARIEIANASGVPGMDPKRFTTLTMAFDPATSRIEMDGSVRLRTTLSM